MHRLLGRLSPVDKVFRTTIAAACQLAGAAIDIHRYDAGRRGQRLFRHAFKDDFHKGIPRWLGAFRPAFITGDLIFNCP